MSWQDAPAVGSAWENAPAVPTKPQFTPAEEAQIAKYPASMQPKIRELKLAGRQNTAGFEQGLFDVERSAVDQPLSWLERHLTGSHWAQDMAESHAKMAAGIDKDMGDGISPQIMRIIGNAIALAPLALSPLTSGGATEEGVAGLVKSAPAIAKNLVPRMAAGAVQGAEAGALTSAGNDKSLGENAGIGALTGAAFAPVTDLLTGAGRVIGRVARYPVDLVKRAMSAADPVNAPDVAGHVLREVTQGNATFEDAPLPGMKLTAGQSSNNPGLLAVERSLEQTPEGGTALAESRTANNQSILDAIRSIGDTEADAPAAMAKAIESAERTTKANASAAFKAIGLDENATQVPIGPLKDSVSEYVAALPKAEKNVIPKDFVNILTDDFGEHESLAEIQALSSRIGGAARTAARAGNANDARVIGGLRDKIEDYIDPENVLNQMGGAPVDPETARKLIQARDLWNDYKQTFSKPKGVRGVLGVDRYGEDKIPTSATAEAFIQPSTRKGAPEAFDSYMKAIGNDEAGLQAARDAFSAKFLDAVTGVQPDGGGDRFVKPGAVTKFLDQYDHVTSSPLFTDVQRDLMARIGQASDMAMRTVRGGAKGGSDTFAKFASDRYLDVLIGPGASKLVPALTASVGGAAGGVAGSLFGGAGTAMGAGAGAFVGKEMGDQLLDRLYAAPRARVMDLLHEAFADPRMAQALMLRAAPGRSAYIAPAVRSKIMQILGPTGAALSVQRLAAPALQQAP